MEASITTVLDLFVNPCHSRWVSAILMAAEAVLGALIIWKIPYTEIDWTTYMQQVRLFVEGERDYSLIKGDTGPLVYPAIHLYIYHGLYQVTDQGTDIALAQAIFHLLYLITLAVVFACYRKVGAPPWLLIPLVLSKRLHSIFHLRLFNDTWAALALWLAIYSFQRRNWLTGAIAWCLAVGVKMVALLAAPAVGAILLQGAGVRKGVLIGLLIPQLQFAFAFPFLTGGHAREYVTSAFDLGRQFLFKWTVNWRFVGEETFLTPIFAYTLLAIHLGVLILFLHTRWLRPSSTGILDFVQRYTRRWDERVQGLISQRIRPRFIMDAMLGSMLIGLLFARSLHYQFYAYIAWSTPYLLWRSGLGPIWVLANCAIQEMAWLTYPSTNLSSSVVIFQLLNAVVSVWWGASEEPVPSTSVQDPTQKRADSGDTALHGHSSLRAGVIDSAFAPFSFEILLI